MFEIQSPVWVLWNIFLAVIPVALAHLFVRTAGANGTGGNRRGMRALSVAIAIPWLLFVPNTCYLLTEWRHFLETLRYHDLNVRWQGDSGLALRLMIYTLFYMVYSGVGVLCFTLSVRPVAELARQRGATLWVWAMPFFALMSLGVYLGLILRFNSWDLLRRPGEIWTAVASLAYRPALSAAVLFFAVFLWIVYTAVNIWVDGVACRWMDRSRER